MRFAIFFLFVFSGLLKWLPWPYDPTLIFGVASLVAFSFGARLWLRLDSSVVLSAALFTAFSLWYLTTALYTSSNSFYVTKSMGVVLALSALWAPLSLRWKEADEKAVAFSIVAAGVVCGALVVMLFNQGRLTVFTDPFLRTRYPNYLAVGDLLATSAIAMIFGVRRPLLVMPALLACIFGLVVLGGRGPLVGLVFSTLVGLALRRSGKRSLLFYLPVAVALLYTFARPLLVEDTGFNRILHSLDEGGQALTSSRLEVMADSWVVFRNNPVLGTGIGSLGVELIDIDMTASPHNLFVEAAAETGVIGLVLFAAALATCIVAGLQIRESQFGVFLLVLLNYELFQFMKSGDFIDARKLFFFAGLVLSYRSAQAWKRRDAAGADASPGLASTEEA